MKNNNNEQEFYKGATMCKKEIDKKAMPFLVLGILMAFCCNMPFGVAVILINELKYKPNLESGKIKEADSTKTIMIIILVVGLILGILFNMLVFLLEFVAELI